jgi:outer membrane protein OmpA-like peptidoglycan-associated protein
MGENINSSGFEISPYLSPNDDTLFFSSDGFGGSGDADIFYSLRTGETWSDWSKPINIGPKINSPKFDAYFTFSGNNFYWSSNRDNKLADIYYTTIIPPLYADITSTDVTFYSGSDGTVSLSVRGGVPPYSYNWSSGQEIEDLTTVPKGIYSVTVTDSYGQQITLSAPVNEPKLLVELTDAIIYFDRQSSYLNPQNKEDLDVFVEQINASNPSMTFQVVSHCDKRSSVDYNLWLGERRMNRTIDYLVSKGIDRNRIKGDFQGESQPDINCESCTETQFTLNRRTIIKVVKP